ncbi:MAG: dihydrofolate reductase [Imperialibacter sp.]|uniref:dihydrofolate reductase n=1 Tax=Imperialibacter sp. TaxID=2038411 RepID=UPI0032EE3239
MIISQIVAVSRNGVIGNDYKMLWHMPKDFRYFKDQTMGHHVLMGRKTFESLGKILPGRTFIIVTRDKNFSLEGAHVVDSIEKGIALAKAAREEELYIIGGGEVYKQTQPISDILYITEIDVIVEGNVKYPLPDTHIWKEVSRKDMSSDEKNPYNYSFTQWKKRK